MTQNTKNTKPHHSLFVSDCPLTTYVFAPTDAWTVGVKNNKHTEPKATSRVKKKRTGEGGR